jgi:hypothetical protein
MPRIQTRFKKRHHWPDMTPAQIEASLRAASTDDLRAAYNQNTIDFPTWSQSKQLRTAQAIMFDELQRRDNSKGKNDE